MWSLDVNKPWFIWFILLTFRYLAHVAISSTFTTGPIVPKAGEIPNLNRNPKFLLSTRKLLWNLLKPRFKSKSKSECLFRRWRYSAIEIEKSISSIQMGPTKQYWKSTGCAFTRFQSSCSFVKRSKHYAITLTILVSGFKCILIYVWLISSNSSNLTKISVGKKEYLRDKGANIWTRHNTYRELHAILSVIFSIGFPWLKIREIHSRSIQPVKLSICEGDKTLYWTTVCDSSINRTPSIILVKRKKGINKELNYRLRRDTLDNSQLFLL